MTTRILKRYDLLSMEYLQTLIDLGFKTALQVVKREKTIQRAKDVEISKIINILGREAKY